MISYEDQHKLWDYYHELEKLQRKSRLFLIIGIAAFISWVVTDNLLCLGVQLGALLVSRSIHKKSRVIFNKIMQIIDQNQ